MYVYPAIDLLDGQVVRLLHGDYSKVTVYETDALRQVEKIAGAGATHIHIVDLNAARDGGEQNLPIIARIAALFPSLHIQCGGGIRNMADLRARWDAGIQRAIIGTSSVENTAFLEAALNLDRERVAVALDCLGEQIRTRGWLNAVSQSRSDFLKRLKCLGLRHLVYTEISRDGTLQGPDIAESRKVIEQSGMAVIVSGGIHSPEDLQLAQASGAAGVIVGRAYYEGLVDIEREIKRYQQ